MNSRIAVIDFEATGFPAAGGSWPIEVAIGWPATGNVQSWLIKPDPTWLTDWNWDAKAAAIHRIDRGALDTEGIPARRVARDVATAMTNADVILSDMVGLDEFWAKSLMLAIPVAQRPIIHFRGLAEYLAKVLDLPTSRVWDATDAARAEVSKTAPITHRAGDDVAHYVKLIRHVMDPARR